MLTFPAFAVLLECWTFPKLTEEPETEQLKIVFVTGLRESECHNSHSPAHSLRFNKLPHAGFHIIQCRQKISGRRQIKYGISFLASLRFYTIPCDVITYV